jgi:hypothetical protein
MAAVGGLAIPDKTIGYVVTAAAVVVTPTVYGLLVWFHDGRRRLRVRATEIVKGLIREANRLQNHASYRASIPEPMLGATDYASCSSATVLVTEVPAPGEKPFDEQIEDWRAVVGYKLRGTPFTSDAYDFVMVKGGHRLNGPLAKLREMLADINRWVNYGED